ncbi:hypothetical protein Pcinc_042452 [Petrolisthes cinctipes]|uniref:Uncharacterized protein n=1 Tax=Petrolisthes cinctipes TaxID=88211 RepID=A0AAE1BKM2_PETCI|nr:hypothetical protein Pcinc_042452 [Petrolisthes cinctipes]
MEEWRPSYLSLGAPEHRGQHVKGTVDLAQNKGIDRHVNGRSPWPGTNGVYYVVPQIMNRANCSGHYERGINEVLGMKGFEDDFLDPTEHLAR